MRFGDDRLLENLRVDVDGETVRVIGGHGGPVRESAIDRVESHAALANSYINRANCVAAEVVRDLTPTAAPLMMPAITPAR